MILIYFGLVIRLLYTEARVFCQDVNATPWRALGYSCPLNCDNIIGAIEKLKSLDYERFYKDGTKTIPNWINEDKWLESVDVKSLNVTVIVHTKNFRRKVESTKTIKTADLYQEILKILLTEDLLAKLTKQLFNMPTDDETCRLLLKKSKKHLFVKKISKCARRMMAPKRDFFKIITDTFNGYSTEFIFDENMVKQFLLKVLGSSIDLRDGDIDVKTVLIRLKEIIKSHQGHLVRLKSTHCLTTYVPGCFCKSGYVENAGGCVAPDHCPSIVEEFKYLNRLIIE